jgi:hypothetical protein
VISTRFWVSILINSFPPTKLHNILEPVMGWPSKTESKIIVIPKIWDKTTCVTKVKEIYMWQ